MTKTNRHYQRILTTFLLLTCLHLPFPLLAQTANPVGVIVSQTGSVSILSADGKARQANRRAKIYPGDEVITEEGARVQIRFVDSGLMLLQAGTSLSVSEQEGLPVFRLQQGGLQVMKSPGNEQGIRVETSFGRLTSARGHLVLALCTSSCAGSPPGFYGGIVEGSVELCNAGGCTKFSKDDYFYAENNNASARTLIAAPSLLFNNPDNNGATQQFPSTEKSPPSNDVVIQCSNGGGSSNPCNPGADTPEGTLSLVQALAGIGVEDMVPNDDQNMDPPVTPVPMNPPVPPVPMDSGSVGFAAAVLTAGVNHTSASGYATDDLTFLGGAVNSDAVKAGSFINFDCVANAGGDCLDADIQPTMLDQANEISTASYDAIVGRWAISDEVFYEDNPYDIEQFFHFAFSQDDTVDVTAVSSFIVNYNLFEPDGTTVRANSSFTNPTDQDGNSGSIDLLNMSVDFMSQQLTAFNIEAGNDAGAGTGGFQISAWLPAPVSLAGESIQSFGLIGIVTDDDTGCTIGCLNDTASGIVNTTFLGTEADGVLGSYNLFADTLNPQLAGTFLIEAAQVSNSAPMGSVALNTAILDASAGSSLIAVLAGSGKNAISFSGVSGISTTGLITHDNGAGTLTENAVVNGVVSSDMTNFDLLDGVSGSDFDCVDCFGKALQPGPADLSDIVKHVALNYTAYWGRWSDQQVSFNTGSGDENYNAADMFYAYSEDLTPDVSATAIGSTTLNYSSILGSNPIDQDGVSGTLGATNMDINFGSQQITAFDINLTTADGDWDAHLPYVTGTTIQDPVALSGAVNSFAVQGLASDPTGGITAAGTSTRYDIYGDVNTALLGPNAEAVLGTYNLSVIDSLGAPNDAEAIGTFLLER